LLFPEFLVQNHHQPLVEPKEQSKILFLSCFFLLGPDRADSKFYRGVPFHMVCANFDASRKLPWVFLGADLLATRTKVVMDVQQHARGQAS
jgi:hypothetical protein